jgi:transposase InsO family protein
MKQLTAQTAIENLMEVFARYGLVEVLVSDGGPAFIAERFKEFMITNSIKHIISPLGHPSTNGQAENTIKMVKTSTKAAIEESKAKSANPYVNEIVLNHILNYRSTKPSVTKETPAKLLLGREVRTMLDCIRPSTVRDTIINHKRKQIEHHKGKRHVEFEMNQDVLVANYSNSNCT